LLKQSVICNRGVTRDEIEDTLMQAGSGA